MDMFKGRGRSPLRRQWGAPKAVLSQRSALRLAVVIVILAFVRIVDLHVHYRDALRAKYLPTDFAKIPSAENVPSGPQGLIDDEVVHSEREDMLANRDQWRLLGGGYEGVVYTYNDSVIKIYEESWSTFRNCHPSDPRVSWPAEIPATLLLGGLESDRDFDVGPHRESFIPVRDYFLAKPAAGASTPESDAPSSLKWHMVTPFIRAGTLQHLGKRLSTSDPPQSPGDIDRVYRPAFESLLSALGYMHEEHRLCHDDVKLDNVFVASEQDPTRWMLADLGNAREPSHPYHQSALWTSDTPQHADCRINDIIRLTQSYLDFVRLASSDSAVFDAAFFDASEPLFRLYWGVMRDPAGAAEVKRLSDAHLPAGLSEDLKSPLAPTSASGDAPLEMPTASWSASVMSFLIGRRPVLAWRVSRQLRVGSSELWAKVFGLTPLLGTPRSGCQAVAG